MSSGGNDVSGAPSLESRPGGLPVSSRCPVCRATFRCTSTCSRCGADLGPLMALQVRAWQLREASRRAVEEGDPLGAARLARESQRLHRTPAGEALQGAVADDRSVRMGSSETGRLEVSRRLPSGYGFEDAIEALEVLARPAVQVTSRRKEAAEVLVAVARDGSLAAPLVLGVLRELADLGLLIPEMVRPVFFALAQGAYRSYLPKCDVRRAGRTTKVLLEDFDLAVGERRSLALAALFSGYLARGTQGRAVVDAVAASTCFTAQEKREILWHVLAPKSQRIAVEAGPQAWGPGLEVSLWTGAPSGAVVRRAVPVLYRLGKNPKDLADAVRRVRTAEARGPAWLGLLDLLEEEGEGFPRRLRGVLLQEARKHSLTPVRLRGLEVSARFEGPRIWEAVLQDPNGKVRQAAGKALGRG